MSGAKILGIDYGLRKVGLAVVETESKLAEPITVIHPAEVIAWIRKNRAKYSIDRIVIGLAGGKLDQVIRAFGRNIETKFSTPVHYFDETLSTQDAQANLRNNFASRKKRKKVEDAVAAAVMLQSYLDYV